MLFNLGKPDFTRVQYPALLEDWPSLGVLKTIIGVFFFLSTLPIVRGLDIGIFPGVDKQKIWTRMIVRIIITRGCIWLVLPGCMVDSETRVSD